MTTPAEEMKSLGTNLLKVKWAGTSWIWPLDCEELFGLLHSWIHRNTEKKFILGSHKPHVTHSIYSKIWPPSGSSWSLLLPDSIFALQLLIFMIPFSTRLNMLSVSTILSPQF